MLVKISDLKILVSQTLSKQGYSPEESKIISKILLYAQLRGNNQGIVKLIGKGIPKRDGAQTPKIVKETPVSALVDGHKTHAMIVMDYLATLAIAKAKQSGIGIAGNSNTNESTGALGYYVNKISQSGFIGFAFSSSPFQTSAPYGSTEARFCTNPIAVGIPTTADPILLDMSTSAIAYYGLIEAKTAGKKVPEGTGYDQNGNPTTDPAHIMSGAIKTFAGHKGSGLALVVQILASSLVGADSFNSDSDNSGNLILAIDPNIFTAQDKFRKNVSGIVSQIKSARRLPEVQEILVPGERGNRITQERLTKGEIDIESNLYSQFQALIK